MPPTPDSFEFTSEHIDRLLEKSGLACITRDAPPCFSEVDGVDAAWGRTLPALAQGSISGILDDKDYLLRQLFEYAKSAAHKDSRQGETHPYRPFRFACGVGASDHFVTLALNAENIDANKAKALAAFFKANPTLTSFEAFQKHKDYVAQLENLKGLYKNPQIQVIESTQSEYIASGPSASLAGDESKKRYMALQAQAANTFGVGNFTYAHVTPFHQSDDKGGAGNDCPLITALHTQSFLKTGKPQSINNKTADQLKPEEVAAWLTKQRREAQQKLKLPDKAKDDRTTLAHDRIAQDTQSFMNYEQQRKLEKFAKEHHIIKKGNTWYFNDTPSGDGRGGKQQVAICQEINKGGYRIMTNTDEAIRTTLEIMKQQGKVPIRIVTGDVKELARIRSICADLKVPVRSDEIKGDMQHQTGSGAPGMPGLFPGMGGP